MEEAKESFHANELNLDVDLKTFHGQSFIHGVVANGISIFSFPIFCSKFRSTISSDLQPDFAVTPFSFFYFKSTINHRGNKTSLIYPLFTVNRSLVCSQ